MSLRPASPVVCLKSAQNEAAGGIDEDLSPLIRGQLPQGRHDHALRDLPTQFPQALVRLMLAGDHHADDPAGQAEHILHRHLSFSVRPQAPDRACFSGIGQQAGQAVGQHNGQGKQLVRLQACVTVHDPLIASSPLRGGGSAAIHSLRDVAALIVGNDLDLIVRIISGFMDSLGNDGRNVRDHLGGDLTAGVPNLETDIT